ncbi:O-antigen translocase [Vibrio alginolyticus]|uniref:O-antigen translocase n=1 Tax=Vibrio alginolyticus TaxID=663 RepID=UPI001BD1FE0A|nr:O-antigen translocase [Vibrio alginolyticus]MBS9832123.1 O-antigen translocase [Vibrio alginolyticus]MBS9965750.1 O-antigen translocase [Vibrio alginolyticus]
MNLLKTSMLSFLATGIKMLSGLVINKAVSVLIGPSGLALIGQLQNSQGFIRAFAQGGINSGVTKYTAEYSDDTENTKRIWSTALKITLLCSIITSILMMTFSSEMSKYIFNTEEYSYVFSLFAITITLFSLNQLVLSILNGLKEIRTYISINIAQSIVGLILTLVLVYFYRLDGALIALVTNQSLVSFVLFIKLRKHKKIIIKNFTSKFDKKSSRRLLNYTLMTLASTLAVPMSMIFIRNYVGENISWDAAGYWQAMNYISSTYLLMITTALATYYLPRLSEIKLESELKKELKIGFLVIVPLVTIISIFVYLLKDFVVWTLFTKDFYPMLVLFKWQLIGNVLKMSSWLISYLMLSKSMTKEFVISEIAFSVSYTLLCFYFVNNMGIEGLSFAYFLNYLMYFFIMMFWMSRIIRTKYK